MVAVEKITSEAHREGEARLKAVALIGGFVLSR